MTKRKTKIIFLAFALFTGIAVSGQDSTDVTGDRGFIDPEANKILPDKVYEIGLPLLFLFLLVNGLITLYQLRLDQRLKLEALNKGLSEETILELFRTDRVLKKYAFLKWFLLLLGLGLSLLTIHLLAYSFAIRSGYLALGIIMFFLSAGFLVYYRMIRDK